MRIEDAQKIVKEAVRILTSLTNVTSKEIRLESFVPQDDSTYLVGLSINRDNVWWQGELVNYEIKLGEDCSFKSMKRRNSE